MSKRKQRGPSFARLVALLAAGTTPSAAAGQDYWADVANSGRCVRYCDVPLPPAPSTSETVETVSDADYAPSALSVNYQGFLTVVDEFESLTPVTERFRAMTAPSSLHEYEMRVTWFYESAYREEDRLVQARDKVRSELDKERGWLARATAEADVYRPQVLPLERQLEPIRERASALVRETSRWSDIVDRTRAAEKAWSISAYLARGDVLDLIQAVVPARLLRITDARIAAAESLAPRSATRPGPIFDTTPVRVVAPSSAFSPPKWYPLDRPLAIDSSLPTPVKIQSLRTLALRMQNTAQAFDRDFADLKAVQARNAAAVSDRDRLRSQVETLKGNIAGYSQLAETAARDLLVEKAEFPIARDQMTLKAIQTWVWTQARDRIVIPKAKEFLVQNGFGHVAARLQAEWLTDGIQAVRELSWEKVINIRGANEFAAVQQKVLGLLDPTKSAILQSAQFNAMATPDEAERFSRELFGRLGEDGEALMTSAGQANVPGPYRGLAARLLRK